MHAHYFGSEHIMTAESSLLGDKWLLCLVCPKHTYFPVLILQLPSSPDIERTNQESRNGESLAGEGLHVFFTGT